MMRRRLLRGIAAAVISLVTLLSWTAQPALATAGAPQLAKFSLDVMGILAAETAGGLAADEIQQLWRDTQAALNEAKAEIIDHADRLVIGDLRGEVKMLTIKSYYLNPGYPSYDQRVSYAHSAMRVGAIAGSQQREMRTDEAAHDLGYAMMVGYQTGIVAYLKETRPPLPVEAASHAFKSDLNYLIERLSQAPDCVSEPVYVPELVDKHECTGFGVVATGEERCVFLGHPDCPQYMHRYKADDGTWGEWSSGRLDQQKLKDKVLDNTIYDTAIVTYANLLVFMDEMGFN